MKLLVLLFGFLGILLRLVGLGLYIATIVQAWGSGFWKTILTIVFVGLSSMYWAYQWWPGFGWNFSTLVLVFLIVYGVYLIIDKILAVALGVDEE